MDLEKMTIKELTDLYNSKTKGKVIKKFESKAKAIERIKKILSKNDKPKVTKVSIIRAMFKDKGAWTREEIMSRTGFDSRNAHTAMNILKNAARTKNPLNFIYDRKTQTYKLVNYEISDN